MNNHLKLTGMQFPPFMFLDENDKYDCHGITCNLIKYLSRSLNFTFEFIKYINQVSISQNGNWTGPFGIVQQGVRYLSFI